MSDETPGLYLPVDWYLEEWMEGLPFHVRGAWIAVLTHVRALGNGRGSCKAVPASQFAGMYAMTTELAEALIAHAASKGALVIEGGRWTVADWRRYQSPEAEKKRRLRRVVPDKPALSGTNDTCPGQTPLVPDNCHLSPQNVQMHTLEGQNSLPPDGPPPPQHSPSPPISPQPSKNTPREAFLKPTFEQVEAYMTELALPEGTAAKFMNHYTANGWRVGSGTGKTMKDWRAACRTWLDKFKESEKRRLGASSAAMTAQNMGKQAMEAIYGQQPG